MGYVEAIAAHDQVILINPEFVEDIYNKGYDLLHLGMKEEAIEQWRQAVKIDPYYYAAWHNIGLVLLDLGQLFESIDVFNHENNNPYIQKQKIIGI